MGGDGLQAIFDYLLTDCGLMVVLLTLVRKVRRDVSLLCMPVKWDSSFFGAPRRTWRCIT